MNKSPELQKGEEVKFIGYTIKMCTNNDGIVLLDEKGNHKGNFGENVDCAKMSAVVDYMIERPDIFGRTIYYRVLGRGGQYHEFFCLVQSFKKDGIEMPPELVEPINGINMQIGYKGKPFSF